MLKNEAIPGQVSSSTVACHLSPSSGLICCMNNALHTRQLLARLIRLIRPIRPALIAGIGLLIAT